MKKTVYILVLSNYGELESECPHDDIIGVYDTFEKAKSEMRGLLLIDIKDFNYVYDEDNFNEILVDDTIRVFKNYQDNWNCYSEYRILEKVVE